MQQKGCCCCWGEEEEEGGGEAGGGGGEGGGGGGGGKEALVCRSASVYLLGSGRVLLWNLPALLVQKYENWCKSTKTEEARRRWCVQVRSCI